MDERNEEMYENEELITLRSTDGEEIEFHEIAGIALESGFYLILQPVELLPEMTDEEALVFKVTELENGDCKYDLEIEDEIVEAVFEEYYRLLDEMEKNQ